MSRKRLFLIAAFLAAIFCSVSAAPAFATNYFVSSSTGSDSNSGTSTAAPWQSLSKVNGFAFSPGDQIEFLRGDTWTGELDITVSGTSANRINFFGYGTSSSRPKITGGGSNGACIYSTGSFLTIDNLTTTACGTSGNGKGVDVTSPFASRSSDVLVKNMSSTNNSIGIAALSGGANIEFQSNTVSNNSVANSGLSDGGNIGILVQDTSAVVDLNNVSGSLGTAGGIGAGVDLVGDSNVWVHNNYISNNNYGVRFSTYADGVGSGNAVEYNVIPCEGSGDGCGTGIDMLSGTGSWVSHNSVGIWNDANNSIGINCPGCDSGSTITSNAVTAHTSIIETDGGSHPTITGNSYAGGGPTASFTLPSSNVSGYDPVSINSPLTYDLSEKPDSSSIDAATVTNFSSDYNADPVPDGSESTSDSGAYEYQDGVTRTWTVTKAGSGTGTVTSSPTGINCGSTCAFAFPYNTTVTLTETPDAGSTFAGWSGTGCSGTGTTCTLTLTKGSASYAMTATFNTSVPSPPSNTSPPNVGGDLHQGNTLTTTNGSWTGSPTSFSYQWQSCVSGTCSNVGTNSASYTTVSGDVGHTIDVIVTATNANGSTPATSNTVGPILAPVVSPPTNTVAPVVSGSTTQGSVLTTTNGTWTNSPTSFTYQWKSCVSGTCSNVGTNSTTYTTVSGDVGHTVEAVVTASNSGGSNNATSNAVGPITSGSSTINHVVVIVGENTGYCQVISHAVDSSCSGTPSADPYILNTLVPRWGLFTNYFAITHPSLPNYLALTMGSTQGKTGSDCNVGASGCGPFSTPEGIFGYLGTDAKSLMESMPSACDTSNSGNYAVRHNPELYDANVTSTICNSNDIAYNSSSPDISAKYTFLKPNLCNDGHSPCGLSDFDTWLSNNIPTLLSTSAYGAGHTAIIITWDEDQGSSTALPPTDAEHDHVATIVLDPNISTGTQNATALTHYSTLKYAEDVTGATASGSESGSAASATSLAGKLGL